MLSAIKSNLYNKPLCRIVAASVSAEIAPAPYLRRICTLPSPRRFLFV